MRRYCWVIVTGKFVVCSTKLCTRPQRRLVCFVTGSLCLHSCLFCEELTVFAISLYNIWNTLSRNLINIISQNVVLVLASKNQRLSFYLLHISLYILPYPFTVEDWAIIRKSCKISHDGISHFVCVCIYIYIYIYIYSSVLCRYWMLSIGHIKSNDLSNKWRENQGNPCF